MPYLARIRLAIIHWSSMARAQAGATTAEENGSFMRIGIGLPNQVRNVRPTVIPQWAALAEQAGFSSLSTVGRIAYPGVADTVALAGAAGATSTIGLLSTVLLAPVWPPALLAKEIAGIDGISGGRLTLGVGVGGRADDFVADGHGIEGRGKRFDGDLDVYHEIWRGRPYAGSDNPAVPDGTREVPLLFGAGSPAAFKRMARWGEGYIAPSLPAEMVAGTFDAARGAWREAGRAGDPRLVAICYFAIADANAGRANVYDYYSNFGDETANMITGALHGTEDTILKAVKAFQDLGADELIFNPSVDDLDEVSRLADLVL
jgi:alkanesulfonate monooxygenase SsuD/methylene tetrahydromethanopterin reductase-like flavin-dependent oxidoreductase (luciferase family)